MIKYAVLALFAASLLAPNLVLAADHEKKDGSYTDKAVGVVKENPGSSVGVVACGVAIAFFPPALLVCGGAVAAGAGVDYTNKK